MKSCTGCLLVKDLEAFPRDRTKPDGRHPRCKECHRLVGKAYREQPGVAERQAQKNKEWRAANPDRSKRGVKCATLRAKYGITLEEYEALLAKQNGLCAICEAPESSWGSMAVDHNHETGEVRGLLCFNCNTALGKFNDDIQLLLKAVAYLGGTSSVS